MADCAFRIRLARYLIRVALLTTHFLSCVLIAWLVTDVATAVRHLWKFAEFPTPIFSDGHFFVITIASALGLAAVAATLRARRRLSKSETALARTALPIYSVTFASGLVVSIFQSVSGVLK